MGYITVANIRKLAASKGKRVGKGFLLGLEIAVEQTVRSACRIHNGGKITLDENVLPFCKQGLK